MKNVIQRNAVWLKVRYPSLVGQWHKPIHKILFVFHYDAPRITLKVQYLLRKSRIFLTLVAPSEAKQGLEIVVL